MGKDRGQKLLYLDEDVGRDDAAVAPVIAVANFTGTGPRTSAELEVAIAEKRIDSVEDACRKFGVRVEGCYLDVEGKTQSVSFQATGAESFTPTGMTLQDPHLFQFYMNQRLCEHVIRMSGAGVRGTLSAEQIAQLEADIDQLEQSLKGVEV